jgi:hypothetical protein
MRKSNDSTKELNVSSGGDGAGYFTYPCCWQNENNCDGWVDIRENACGKCLVRLVFRVALLELMTLQATGFLHDKKVRPKASKSSGIAYDIGRQSSDFEFRPLKNLDAL